MPRPLSNRCLKDRGDFEDIIDFAENQVFKIAEAKGGQSFSSLGQLIDINIDTLEERQGSTGGLSGLSTGYSRLDAPYFRSSKVGSDHTCRKAKHGKDRLCP